MLSRVIKKPHLSEKSLKDVEKNIYTFLVDARAGKEDVVRALKEYFDVEVVSVKTSINKGKRRRIRNTSRERKASEIKKAVVSLKEGQKFDFFSRG